MSLKLMSAGGGSVDLVAPSTASALTVTMPSATGVLASGAAVGQVQFPASQNISADPNCLDDYEEGIGTQPAFSFATVGNFAATYSAAPTPFCRYTKIGNRVFVTLDVRALTFTWTTASGQLFITNAVPFAPLDGIFIPIVLDGGTWTGVAGSPSGYIAAGQTSMNLEYVGNPGGQRSIITQANATTGSIKSVFANFSYTV